MVNLPLDDIPFSIGISWEQSPLTTTPNDLNLLALVLDKTGLVLNICRYNELSVFEGALVHSGEQISSAEKGAEEAITVDLSKVGEEAHHIIFAMQSVSRWTDRVTYESAKVHVKSLPSGGEPTDLTSAVKIAPALFLGVGLHLSFLGACTRLEGGKWDLKVAPVLLQTSGYDIMGSLKLLSTEAGVDLTAQAAHKDKQPEFEFSKKIEIWANVGKPIPLQELSVQAEKKDDNLRISLSVKNTKIEHQFGIIALDRDGKVVHIVNNIWDSWSEKVTSPEIVTGTPKTTKEQEFTEELARMAVILNFPEHCWVQEGPKVTLLEDYTQSFSIQFKLLPPNVDALFFTTTFSNTIEDSKREALDQAALEKVMGTPFLAIQKFQIVRHTQKRKPTVEKETYSMIKDFPLPVDATSRSVVALGLYRNDLATEHGKWHVSRPDRFSSAPNCSAQVSICQELHATFHNYDRLPASFIPKPFVYPKSVKITILGGTGIRCMGFGSKPDAYVTVWEKGTMLLKTKVDKRTPNPVWNESFEIDPAKTTALLVSVWDKKLLGVDRKVACLQWDIPFHLFSEEAQTVSLELPWYWDKKLGKQCPGTLNISFEATY